VRVRAPRHLRRRFRHSVGARLVGLFLVLALAVSATFLFGMQSAFRGGWQDYARPLVANYIDRLVDEIGTPPDLAKAQALVARLPLHIRIDGPVVNWDSQPDAPRRFGPRDDRNNDSDSDDAERSWQPVRLLADGHRIRFGLADLSHEERPRRIGWFTLAALLLLTALAYASARRLLRPLRDIRAGAIRYGQGDFSQPIAQRGHDELAELAGQINRMAGNLHHMLEAKRALLLAISHELRSPLTRARLHAELLADGDERNALLRDLGEMRDLIADLLESERLAAGHAALATEPTDLNALVQEVLVAHFAGRAVHTELADGLPLLALDRSRWRLLVRNLLDNAWRHGAGGEKPPILRTWRDGEQVCMALRDHGPGVPEAQLAQLGEAFYRPDEARQRATGGVGLGLHLCRLVAQAHGATWSLRNAGPGLEVEVRLPVAAPAAA
jgi:signal transduction histidine kinase